MNQVNPKQNFKIGSAAEAALTYAQFGWEPLVLPFKEKSPRGKWKEPCVWTPDSINSEFGGDVNLGLALGTRPRKLIKPRRPFLPPI